MTGTAQYQRDVLLNTIYYIAFKAGDATERRYTPLIDSWYHRDTVCTTASRASCLRHLPVLSLGQ